jgi:molecular chaperone GrpE
LISEQDKEIEGLKEQVKQYKEKLIYQLAENDNTVKRYKKEIDSTREFAISKFAKDLLDVRDNLQMGFDYAEKIKLDGVKDLEELKRSFVEVKKGMGMTENVMDACLKRFGVVQFEPLGEKFNPNLHEAIFTIPESEYANNTVGTVMVSGWKIGDRVLRAAKVGIVKKPTTSE